MDILQFLVLSFVNVALLYWIIKRQGLISAEGYCAAWIGVAVLSDNVMLVLDYFFNPANLPLRGDEFNFRAFPTVVHIIGLLVLMAGLFLGNPKPVPVRRECSEEEFGAIGYTGGSLVFLGLVMSGITIYLTGALGPNFFSALDTFRVGDQAGSAGGFYYRGADCAVFGMALLAARLRKNGVAFFSLVLAMMATAMFLRANKGGAETAMFFAAGALYTYNRPRFRALLKPRFIILAFITASIGIGIKGQLRKGESRTATTVSDAVLKPLKTRWGDQGLYRGYCQFINVLPRYGYMFDNYRLGLYSLTEAWVPRAIRPNKRPMPTMGIGYMIHADKHEYKQETPSIELVGSVFADKGFYSLTAYLLILGFFLGVLRRYSAGPRSRIHSHISYLGFILFQGLSAEAGILSIVYMTIFSFGVTGLAHLVVLGIYKVRPPLSVSHNPRNAPNVRTREIRSSPGHPPVLPRPQVL